VGSLAAPAGAMLSDAASALGIGQVIAVALANVAWSAGELAGAAGGGALAQITTDAVPYVLLCAACAGTAVVLRRGTLTSRAADAAHAGASARGS
jgi:hypothetical protein